MLHITNGDIAVTQLRRTGITGTVIAWRDILHEGPVPAGLTLEALSDVRARFLASFGAGDFAALCREFWARDAALRSARAITLWFEHDLYDQLQLVQILAVLAEQPETTADLICIDAFPGVQPFHGLGQLTPTQLASLWPTRRRITSQQLTLASRAWKAFCAPDPIALRELVATDCSALPFVRAALERHLEEFPASPDGLGRTDRQLLATVASGHSTFAALFQANQAAEAAPFLGDSTVKARLDALIQARVPLLTPEPFTLTNAGRRVLAGETDARTLNGLDRWLGGVHLVA